MAIGEAPVSGDVVYGWSWLRYVVAAAALGIVAAVIGWLSVSLLLPILASRPGNLEVPRSAVYVIVYAIFFPLFSLLFARSRPPGLRFGGAWIELAAERRDMVVVPYDAVSSARVRWFWPVAVLDVFIGSADEPRVMRLDRGGRRPLCKRRGDQLRLSMPIAGLRSSAADIRSQLRSRGIGE